ncbi:MAG: DNA repair protein RecO [Eubacteriales bacterium]|nr:DNA repair protein RecO [Eubacteriales bacterium]
MKTKTDGLILRQQNIGEQDKLVTVLTREYGVLRAFVRGAKNIKSPKSAATDILCYSELSIYEGKGKFIIDDANAKEVFFELRSDVEKVSLAQYFCELAAFACVEGQSASQQLSLILNALYLLSKGEKSQELIKACVELRLLSLSGYMPDLVMCRECGVYEAPLMYFVLSRGKIVCENCFTKAPQSTAVPLDQTLLRALRHIVFSEDKKVFAFGLPEEKLSKLSYITESYALRVLEKDFKTLHFYKSIKS